MTSEQKKRKEVKKYAVCFLLNKTCMEGDVRVFAKRADAKKYIVDLHNRIGGFEEDHHIVRITYHL